MSPGPGAGRARGRLGLVALIVLVGTAACSAETDEPMEGTSAPEETTDATTAEETSTAADDTASDTGADTSDGADASGDDGLPTSEEPEPVEAGTHTVPEGAWAVSDLSVTLPEGWAVQYGYLFTKDGDTPDAIGFYPMVVDEVHADACPGTEGESVTPGPGVEDLVEAFRAQEGPEVSEPVQETLAGQEATRVDLVVPEGYDLSGCNAADIGLQVWYSEPADDNLLLTPDQLVRVYVMEVEGERQVVAAFGPREATPEQDAELQAVLDSIEIPG